MIRFFLVFIILFSSVFSSELTPLDPLLIRVEQNLQVAETMEERALALLQLQKVLLSFLKIPMGNEEFYTILRKSRPTIDRIMPAAHTLYAYLYDEELTRRITVTLNGKSYTAFQNLHDDRYEEELVNWQSNNLYALPQKLSSSTIQDLEPGLSYNFIVTLEGRVIISDEQLTSKAMNGQKAILGPNHGILAGGKPVLSAGEFILFQKGDRKILFASSSSGHYRPDFSSLELLREALMDLGFPAEAIVLAPVRLSDIAWLFLQR